LTVTVGPAKADLVGTDEKVLQAAIDYVSRYGGGTVQILPGVYRLRNALFLTSGIRLRGHREETILCKEPSVAVRLAADSDWYDQEITLVDARGFQLGDGVCLKVHDQRHNTTHLIKRTLVARSGNRFKLDRPLRHNFWQKGTATAATLFPLLSGEDLADVVLEDLTLDGNKARNEKLDGNYAGCIYLQDCNRVAIRGVTARNYNGDGMSWQTCHDVRVRDCHVHDNTGQGLHPGSGSQRSWMRGNRIVGNDVGIFLCWGVRYALAEQNTLDSNRSYGISIGHRDTDNLIRNNEVRGSGRAGILFRPEGGEEFAAHRNRVEGNRILDSGGADGVALNVRGHTDGIVLAKNTLREMRVPLKRIGIRLGRQTGVVLLQQNQIEGFANPIIDLRRT
jgi:nitrous oxidase accessory protein NosD